VEGPISDLTRSLDLFS